MSDFDILAKKLAPHYKYFQVSDRLLFTGHSHQAWPDVAFEGQKEAFMVAANRVDEKWEVVFQKAETLRNYLRNYYDDQNGYYSFSANTHDLLVRWLSSLDLYKKSKLITTDGEFYTVARQLLRLEETGIEVVCVPHARPQETASYIRKALCNRTAGIICSHVFYRSSLVHSALPEIAKLAEETRVPLLVDDYHATHVIPLSLRKMKNCYVLGGGYKYLQWGEGNCFLRFPKSCDLRPAITGWFASFENLEAENYQRGTTAYDTGDMRFCGATYESTSSFRAARVVDFFIQQGLSAKVLENQYKQQITYMRDCFLTLDCPPEQIKLLHNYPVSQNGGFLSLQSPRALELKRKLQKVGVAVDARGDVLRFGPAPYIQKQQIQEAFRLLKKVI